MTSASGTRMPQCSSSTVTKSTSAKLSSVPLLKRSRSTATCGTPRVAALLFKNSITGCGNDITVVLLGNWSLVLGLWPLAFGLNVRVNRDSVEGQRPKSKDQISSRSVPLPISVVAFHQSHVEQCPNGLCAIAIRVCQVSSDQ